MDLANRKEISLSELIRRGLEYMLNVSPQTGVNMAAWELPEARYLQSCDVFASENWRADLHVERLKAAENRPDYDCEGGKP